MSRKHRKLPKIRYAVTAAAVLAAVSAIVITEKAVRPSAELQAEHFAVRTAGCTIGQAVADYIEQEDSGILEFDGYSTASVSGRDVNRVQSELTLLINERLENMGKCSAKVPLGTMTGSYLLAGRGPCIRFRVCPTGEAEVRLRSEFTSAGMNQTCHRLYAEVTAEIASSSPLYSFEAEKKFDYILSETIINGEVPFGGTNNTSL
ncbi:sporulation protein YunB [Ruminococcus sp. XPD3002]|uniref:sporulation protein YunB n=1 Tax=Ruminococcus sp. XPD3002 TaxID=1452269 RepID=UPI0009109B1C|nr:sporulation protein YunB [Ruminococcus flavefaciens]